MAVTGGDDRGGPDAGGAWVAPDAPSEPAAPPSPTTATRPAAVAVDDRHAGRRALPAPLRPMTVGDIIDGAFQVLKRAPGTVLAISAVFVIPVQVLAAWLQRDTASDLGAMFDDATQFGSTSSVEGTDFGLSIFLILLGSVAPALVGACLSVLVAAWYRGHDLTTAEVFRRLGAVLPAVLGVFVVTHLVTGVGMVACGAGLIGVVFFMLSMPVVMIEGVGPLDAITRSVRLVSKRFWTSLGIVALSVLLSQLLEISLSIIPTIAAFFVPSSWAWVLLALGASLSSVIVTPIVAAATVLLYLDIRFRVEGLDLELRAADVIDAGPS
jgi:hypothetical protein